MKKLPLGIQNINEIITGNYVYVDKTQYVYNLIDTAKYLFLSRPRRFGKSLLLDTIGEVFKGNKELFKGLWIYDSDYSFDKHPVIRLDMSRVATKSPEILEDSIMSLLESYYLTEALKVKNRIISDVFAELIIQLDRKYGKRVVVLIDEYDKPILDHMTNPDMADSNRQVIRGLYGVLKPLDQYLEFAFITGVSKFTKASIFSELNNLFDITMMEKFANICGVTIDDLNNYFREHITSLNNLKQFRHIESIYDEILFWYDGYSWDGETRVLNPFSLLNFFKQEKFMNFWYSSGNPKFLMDLIKENPESFLRLDNLVLDETSLDVFDIQNMAAAPILFQTGYLTIKEIDYIEVSPTYHLKMPNFEVEDAFNLQVLASLTHSGDVFARDIKRDIIKALRLGNLEQMLSILRGLFASIPYELHVKKEAYYHSIFYALMTLLGLKMNVEVSVSGGKVDAIIEQDDRVYVMEFKYEDCPIDASDNTKKELFEKALDEAMGQIETKGYYKKYLGKGKTIYKVALAFLGRDNIEMRVCEA